MQKNKDELKRYWRMYWMHYLNSLADIKLQERWLNKKITNPAWSYVEFVESYYDQVPDGYNSLIQNGYVSKIEYDCIKDFHKELNKYSPPNQSDNPEDILKDPKWVELVKLCKRSLHALNEVLVDEKEKKDLDVFGIGINHPPLTEGDFTWPNMQTKKSIE
jgi:hypothetical protein